MTSSSATIDYRNTFFQDLHEEPTAEAIFKSTKEMKVNARSVYSDLGGGNYGQLFLDLTPERFNKISITPFLSREHPGPLILADKASSIFRFCIIYTVEVIKKFSAYFDYM